MKEAAKRDIRIEIPQGYSSAFKNLIQSCYDDTVIDSWPIVTLLKVVTVANNFLCEKEKEFLSYIKRNRRMHGLTVDHNI